MDRSRCPGDRTRGRAERLGQARRACAGQGPAYVTFTPPLKTDAAAEEQRTFKFCSVFNNGLKPDGTPDMKMLTQVSLTPEFETFRPTAEACSTGMVGAACLPLFDDRQCDSSAAANDGKCDAASIHFGASTESEMFMMFPDLVMPEGTTESSDIFQSVAIATPLPNVDVQ